MLPSNEIADPLSQDATLQKRGSKPLEFALRDFQLAARVTLARHGRPFEGSNFSTQGTFST